MSKRIYWKTCKKTSIFIDAANVFYSQKTLRWRVDYEKFLNFFKKMDKIKQKIIKESQWYFKKEFQLY